MKLEHISFAYGEKQILADFSLTLPDAGVTALAGPSGCGKTTLLRLLGGLEQPQSGSILVPEKRAFLFQEDRLLPGRSAKEQLRPVLPKGQSAGAWLERVGLAGEEDSLVEALSGGMRRRVALARCMAFGQERELFLLDEPFTGIDPERAALLMRELRSFGVPVVFTAHGAEALALADHVIRLEGNPLRVGE